ncbi:YslB family protein [Weissella hellenica]|nr:YslB family protein [Weissella hellenica]
MTESIQNQEFDNFSLILLRDYLLPELLQNDESEIIYWAGKSLAMKFKLTSIEDIQRFFISAGFGNLTKTDQKSIEQTWILDGPVIKERLENNLDASFSLETGFLAQQIQQLSECGTEAQWSKTKTTVTIRVVTEVPVTLPE